MRLENWLRRRHYEKAVAAYRKDGRQPLKLAHAVRHLGDAHYDAGRAALAEPCYREAVALYRSHERTPSLNSANAIRRLAVLKDEAGEIDEATWLWRETHDHYVAVNERMGVAESAAHLALLALRGGDILQSREWLSEASAAAEASADPDSLRYVRRVRALIEAHD